MASKWDNFLANLGEWRGSFTTITLRDSCSSRLLRC
jgi:hypothetical protein